MNIRLSGGLHFVSLPRTSRLLRSSEYREVYAAGLKLTSRYFAVFCLQRSLEDRSPSRFGFTVPRAVGKAVQRNRIKRRMRHAVRSKAMALALNWSVVFNPRRNVAEAPFSDLCREVERIFSRCNER